MLLVISYLNQEIDAADFVVVVFTKKKLKKYLKKREKN